MNALRIINQLKADHITISLADNGKLDISGNKEKIGKLLPFIRDHKSEIVLHLEQHRPTEIDSILYPCPLCNGDLLSPGLDGCFHRSTLSDAFETMEKNFD